MMSYATVQTRAGGAKSKSSLANYVRDTFCLVDGVDILKLSCSLGHLADGGVDAEFSTQTVDKIEDGILHAAGQMRKIAGEIFPAVILLLQQGNHRGLIELIACKALKMFCPDSKYSEDGDPFLWRLACGGETCRFSSMARATFSLCMVTFLKECSVQNPDAQVCCLVSSSIALIPWNI